IGWALGLALLTVGVLVTLSGALHPNGVRAWMLVVALALAVVLALWPGLAPRPGPACLILLGLARVVVGHPPATTAVSAAETLPAAPGLVGEVVKPGPDFSPSPAIGGPGGYLVLAMAYLFVLLGGWLAWHSPDPVLSRARHLLGQVATLAPRAQFRTL